jgi:hypothetical protein
MSPRKPIGAIIVFLASSEKTRNVLRFSCLGRGHFTLCSAGNFSCTVRCASLLAIAIVVSSSRGIPISTVNMVYLVFQSETEYSHNRFHHGYSPFGFFSPFCFFLCIDVRPGSFSRLIEDALVLSSAPGPVNSKAELTFQHFCPGMSESRRLPSRDNRAD